MWHKIAPSLAERFTVVMPDLRGYGNSAKPAPDDKHLNYSKRAMAQDQIDVMRALGFQRFQAVGHDRGGRVLHRLCLDHPGAVERAAVLDIGPTASMYARTDKAFATTKGAPSTAPSVFFWNVIAASWNNRIENVDVSVTLPGGVRGRGNHESATTANRSRTATPATPEPDEAPRARAKPDRASRG